MEIDDLRGLKSDDLPNLTQPATAIKTEPVYDPRQDGIERSDAQASDPSRPVSHRAISEHILSKTAPFYPAEAKRRHAQGRVRIAAIIGKDGLVHNPVVVHDPDASLSKSALDAVTTWRYRPYLLDGKPVDVRTIIQINFVLGG